MQVQQHAVRAVALLRCAGDLEVRRLPLEELRHLRGGRVEVVGPRGRLDGQRRVQHLARDAQRRVEHDLRNVAHAHLLAAAKLHDPTTCDRVGGGVYFSGEGYAPNYFEFLRPFADACGISMPRVRLPGPFVLMLAHAMEIVHRVTGAEVPFHRFHYHILVKDFFFSNANAERDLGYRPIVPEEEGMAQTVAWVRTLPISS